ncbi:AB hydrolase superfamily protein YvaM [compost metagenome]
MDQLHIDKCYLCGYSTGGSVALEFLLTYPERAWGGIIIGGMSEVNDWRLWKKICLGVTFAKLDAIGTIALSLAVGQTTNVSLLYKLFLDANKGNAHNAEQYYRYSLAYNCTSQLHNIHLPVLLTYGEEDKHFHPYATLLHQQLPLSELVFFTNTDHRIPTKAPGPLNQLIETFIHHTSHVYR